MKTKQLLSVLGSILLFVGVFTPLISIPIVGSFNYFQNGKGDGIFILALAVVSLILALTSHYEWLWLTGGGSLAVLTFTFVQFQLMRQQMLSMMDKDLVGNPFAGLAQLAVNSVQIQWGWALLLVGVGMVLAGAVLKDEDSSASPFFSLPAKTLAIVGVVAVVAVGTWGAAQASSPPVETSQKPVDPAQTASPQAVESSDHNQPAADNATAHDSPTASSASSDDDKQTAPPAAPKPLAQKRAPESALTVDGFSRQDIPDLLIQADSSTAHGDYRLARYEYGVVLKLDRNNVQAREGLLRLAAAWQSR
jgi:hypothetical protein